MAGQNFTVLIEARLKSQIEAQIKALAEKQQQIQLFVKLKLEDIGATLPKDVADQIEKIRQEAKSLSSLHATEIEDAEGKRKIQQYTLEYISKENETRKAIFNLTQRESVVTKQKEEFYKRSDRYSKDYLKTIRESEKLEQDQLRTQEKLDALYARRADQMKSMQIQAQKFDERAKTLSQTPQVREARSIAKQMIDSDDPQRVAELNDKLQVLDAGIRQSGKATWSWAEQMKVAIKRTIEWGAATAVLYGAYRQLREGIQYVIDLNKELTNIQVLQTTGAKTNEQIQDLANSYNDLAIEMGVSTLEIARGSTEWLRSGKSISQTKELLKSTLMLSKLGAIEAADATKYLTAIMNGFNMEAEESESVVDKLVQLDNNYATSVSEIAQAMQRSSASAQMAGVEFDQLAAYITVVSSETRRSASTIGEAFDFRGFAA